ncbi:hypothetical protein NUU61_002102 [Penicillium alfredii]|uniref:Tachykinin family protein n=1 Tax=Penicillium alfredii TaxID=1506179 RepID=A0A9W9FQY7_9EURO|nr:uncharacterized protein NUU61_002102 [Penicillium alfredii]KAJ5104755.1 hypothetical protein NUU61_002102 [Penicillium alfredii]
MSQRDSSSSSGTPNFVFVAENSHSQARSHAMREHWKQRHGRRREAKSHSRRKSRTLVSRSELNEDTSQSHDALTDGSPDGHQGNSDQNREQYPSVATQLLSGLSRTFSPSRPDPFQTCPVPLTSQHQKLLHHWISTHAAMMFEDLDAADFNPMRDVWFPLDLSNPSSFNCVMAHSAAHLAHLYAGTCPQRGTKSSDALRFKAEALRILRCWLVDPKTELSDDAFAAIIRLLTFERYWGTVAEWKIHRDGLQRMIEAKGGVEELRDNWRLELVVYLVSLMSQPSWLESTNNLEEISRLPSQSPIAHPILLSLDIQKVRCLWLISFIQDMRTFMGSFHRIGLSIFPSVHTAVELLRHNLQLCLESTSVETYVSELEDEMLTCLFSIGVILQESISPLYESTSQTPAFNTLTMLDSALSESQDAWSQSVRNLRSTLCQILVQLYGIGDFKVNYVVELVKVLSMLSLEARRGVEKCLLNLFYSLGDRGNMALIDDGWTPDSLLSTVRGH